MASPMTEQGQGQGEKAACRSAREILSTPRTSSTITTTPCTKKWMHLEPCFTPEMRSPSTSSDPSSSARWEEATLRRRSWRWWTGVRWDYRSESTQFLVPGAIAT